MADLSIENLTVCFATPFGLLTALTDVSLTLKAGASLGLVGETGSGKTSLARALLGLHPRPSVSGKIQFGELVLTNLPEGAWRTLRWKRIALGVQNAGTAFDPVYTIEAQILETMQAHLALSRPALADRLETLVQQCGLQARHLRAYPHQLSGGEKQRALLAMALSCQPELLILDEPTSAQDLISRAELVRLIQTLRQEWQFSLLLISHDLAAVSELTQQAAVLYAGRVIEMGASGALFNHPRHPYTWGLLNAYPSMTTSRDLSGIRGQLPDPLHLPSGCRFHPRCTQTVDVCRSQVPALQPSGDRMVACHLGGLQALLSAQNLAKQYAVPGNHARLPVLKDVSLTVYEGEIVAVVGQTGSGKTTLARLLVGMLERDGGRVWLEGQEIHPEQPGAWQSRVQFIPQDPFDAVSPRLTVAEVVREPLEIQGRLSLAEMEERVSQALCAVNLPDDESMRRRYSHQLSGGQLQRVCIARALTVQPKLLIADEPVSMLDPSEQARLIRLIKEVQNERGMGVLLISHDLSLVRKVADRILVLHQGEIVESGDSGRIVSTPQNPFTRHLVNSALRIAEN